MERYKILFKEIEKFQQEDNKVEVTKNDFEVSKEIKELCDIVAEASQEPSTRLYTITWPWLIWIVAFKIYW